MLAIEPSEDAPDSWPSSSSFELAFASFSSSFHYCFNRAIMANLLRPSKADFFFFVLAKGLVGLVMDVVVGVVVVG